MAVMTDGLKALAGSSLRRIADESGADANKEHDWERSLTLLDAVVERNDDDHHWTWSAQDYLET